MLSDDRRYYGEVRVSPDGSRVAVEVVGDEGIEIWIFGLMRGTVTREFASYHLPDESFLYLLHAMIELQPNAREVVHSTDWRMFLMDAADVERELFRLHQFRRVHYEVAGSLAQIDMEVVGGGHPGALVVVGCQSRLHCEGFQGDVAEAGVEVVDESLACPDLDAEGNEDDVLHVGEAAQLRFGQ